MGFNSGFKGLNVVFSKSLSQNTFGVTPENLSNRQYNYYHLPK